MSFESLKLIELKQIAESFGVETPAKVTKAEIISLLSEEGVTYELYAHFNNVEKETEQREEEVKEMQAHYYGNQPEALQQSNKVLVKMERQNASYQVGKYVFTQEHPFVAMPVWEAQHIFDTENGFRLANPSEVQSYYN